MSLDPQPIGPIPEDTARVARAAFLKGTTYVRTWDVLGTIYEDEDFAVLFEVRGRPAIAPWRLALVTVMQFAEELSDQQAAEAVRARIDWKYALGLELTDPGFSHTIAATKADPLSEAAPLREATPLQEVSPLEEAAPLLEAPPLPGAALPLEEVAPPPPEVARVPPWEAAVRSGFLYSGSGPSGPPSPAWEEE